MNEYDRVVDRQDSNAEKYQLRQKLFKTEDVLPMWVADMDIASPPCVQEAIQKRAQHPIYGYEMMPKSAYEAQMAWIKESHGYSMNHEQMLYSHSVVTSMSIAIQAFSEVGDKVIVQTPVYSPFYDSVARNNREVLYNPLKQDSKGVYRFDIENLVAQIDEKTKMLLLCSPHNPVGRVWKREELEAIAKVALEHNLVVFADEIHSDLVYKGHKHIPFGSLSEAVDAITITAYGVGKTFNLAGLATSTVHIANASLFERYKKVYEAIHLAEGNVFGHVAFEVAYREGRPWLEGLLEHLTCNIEMLMDMLSNYKEYITCKRPEGTYLLWLDCRGMGLSNKALRRFFTKETKLGLNPGLAFSKEGSGFMRMNIAVPTATMQQAIKQLKEALERFKRGKES